MSWIIITLALLALGIGVWLGLGAPGWPHKEPRPGTRRRRLEQRSLNPIAWTRRESERRTRHRR
jgi:hypothetical protein